MAITDDYRAIVGRLRGWGFKVTEWSGCYGRSNGGGWSAGKPVGHINHHFVCSVNPDQGYINGLVGNLASGNTVQWFADVHGVAYLIGTGPMNHAGTGMSSVLNRTKSGQAPTGPAGAAGDISGNAHYSGTECQHPGDYTTPWPQPMLDVMVAINAASFLQWGYGAERAINHYEWTSRKIDMTAWQGLKSGGKAGSELRARVAARMTGGGSQPLPPNPLEGLADDMYALVKNENDGTLWACAPGHFQYLSTPEEVGVMQGAGLLSKTEAVTNNRGIDVIKHVCLTGDYEGQPSAVVPN